MIKLLQRFDSSSAATFALRCVDYLPSLIMPLHGAVIGFVEVKEHGDQNRQAAEVFEYNHEMPPAEKKRDPFPSPFHREERHTPSRNVFPPLSPGERSLACFANDHAKPLIDGR